MTLVISETRTTSNKPKEAIRQRAMRSSHKSLHRLVRISYQHLLSVT